MPDIQTEKAWVVFSGQTEISYLKFLRRGFKHCFIVLKRGDHWITLDPLAHKTEIELHYLPRQFNLPEWLTQRGHTVVETLFQQAPMKPLPVSIFTCTETVKRILGVHAWRVFTPWQLYKYLTA